MMLQFYIDRSIFKPPLGLILIHLLLLLLLATLDVNVEGRVRLGPLQLRRRLDLPCAPLQMDA